MKAIEDSSVTRSENVIERLKGILSKATWKHALIIVLPLAIYIYPRPLLKLFFPLVSKINRNHPSVTCNGLPRQVILTSSTLLTWESLATLQSLKQVAPNVSRYSKEEVEVIELFPAQREVSPFSSQVVGAVGSSSDSELLLYSQALWSNYRLARLEHSELKAVLIKSSPEVLKIFLLRFYKLDRRSSHKVGFIRTDTLTVLRLDQRVGTYQHMSCEWNGQGTLH